MKNTKQLIAALKESFQSANIRQSIKRLRTRNRRSRSDTGMSAEHAQKVNDFYDIATDVTQSAWSQSLHFAPLNSGESLEHAIARHQDLMIEKLRLDQSKYVADVGCGIGGPMRRVARQSGAKVLLVNNHQRQLDRAKKLNKEANVDHLADYLHCSFLDMNTIPENTFDAAYAIESTMHASDKILAFEQIQRILKPGGLFWCQEFALTDLYDENDPTHQVAVQDLADAIALGEVFRFEQIGLGLEKAGFKVLDCKDFALECEVPWYAPFKSGYERSLTSFRVSPFQRSLVVLSARLGEFFRAVPKGTVDLVKFLDQGAEAYIRAGELGIATLLCCYLAEKPS
ncbi:MAG: class I SAM-dependent methyltransferase [Gammaproteobacteria bacterium]|nr:class I SAM-dependent methyltransferase [Gammaproteobacteria bacterium]MDE0252810.1 class I SAM-dependent methyltransferase [Gammaproteobacteria bacterium]MDE0402180.1 class I SAM-dependent methyltransferase [Gammaproteobacteria bacterium]